MTNIIIRALMVIGFIPLIILTPIEGFGYVLRWIFTGKKTPEYPFFIRMFCLFDRYNK